MEDLKSVLRQIDRVMCGWWVLISSLRTLVLWLPRGVSLSLSWNDELRILLTLLISIWRAPSVKQLWFSAGTPGRSLGWNLVMGRQCPLGQDSSDHTHTHTRWSTGGPGSLLHLSRAEGPPQSAHRERIHSQEPLHTFHPYGVSHSDGALCLTVLFCISNSGLY